MDAPWQRLFGMRFFLVGDGADESWEADGGCIDILQELGDFNLRC
jgi:hypothetical protein